MFADKFSTPATYVRSDMSIYCEIIDYSKFICKICYSIHPAAIDVLLSRVQGIT
jgi:hypothetical protein